VAMKRILIATDGSESADRAIDFAAALAQNLCAELVIVNICTFSDLSDMRDYDELARVEHTTVGELLTSFSNRVLENASDRARNLGVTALQMQSGHGDAAHAILEIAERVNASSIIVGKRGRGRWASMVLGSVSQKLVNLAPQAVIVVP